jgi:hypothetical protein
MLFGNVLQDDCRIFSLEITVCLKGDHPRGILLTSYDALFIKFHPIPVVQLAFFEEAY